jgi:hypothetical protein
MGTPLNVSSDLGLDLEEIVGQCVAILGIRGSGKSNTAGVIFEELLEHRYPLSVVDIDGEYFGLKERFEVLVVGQGEGVEIEVDVDCAQEIAEISMEKNVPIVLDLSGFLSEDRNDFLKEYLSALWGLAGKLRRPYIVGIEEAHEFIPQGVKTQLKELIARVALRGRKRGLGAIIVSQRSAKVDKDVLSQAGMLFLHRVVHEADMRVYEALLPWRKGEVKEIITALETGDCVYVNGDTTRPIYVRERKTFHAGFTPSLEVVVTPELKQVSQSIVEAIERAKGGKSKRSCVQALQEQIQSLETALAEKEEMIGRLEEVARTLGYIRVEVPALPEDHILPQAASQSMGGEDGFELKSPLATTPRSCGGAENGCDTPFDLWEDVVAIEEMPSPDTFPPAVKRHIDRLVSRVARKQLLDRRVLGFVVSHAPISYSVERIAAWTNCARGVIEDDPPRDFLDMGLLVCERRTDGIHYRSNLKAFVAREFGIYRPNIGERELHLVTQHLRTRFALLMNANKAN